MSDLINVDNIVDAQRFGRFNLKLLIWSFLAMMSDGYQVTVMSFAAPQIAKQWHLAPAALAPTFSASLFGVLIGAPVIGMIGDRFGRKAAIVLSVAIYGLATLSVAWAPGINQITLLLFINGIGLGGLMPNTIALNSELSPRRLRATLVILMFMGITVGSIVPGTLGIWLLPRFGWPALFAVGGSAALAISLGLFFMLPESVRFLAMHAGKRAQLVRNLHRLRPDLVITNATQFAAQHGKPSPGLGLDRIFGDGLALISALLWICFATNLMTNYFLNSWMPLLFQTHGLTPAHAALVSTCYQIGGSLGGIAASILLDRVGYLMVAVMFSIAAPAMVIFGLPDLQFGALAALSMLIGFCVLGAQFGSNATAGMLYETSFRSKGVGWALAVGRVGSISGPLIGGALIARHLPLWQMFLAPAIPMAGGAVCAFVIARLCYRRFSGFRIEDTSPNPD